MKDEKKAPKLRFKGFTDDWEQCKLGDVAEIVGGGTPSTKKSEYWNGNINWFSPAEIGNQIFVSHSHKQITELGLMKSSAKILPAGTILFTSRAGIGNTAILTRNACTNQGFQSIVPYSNKLDSYFIYSESAKLKRYGETMGSGSTFTEVSGKQMKKMSLHIPNINEQAKIGNMLKILDQTITLHEEKKRQLECLKSALLQKMFADKSGYPAVRFKGFGGNWKEQKFGELGTIEMCKRIFKDQTTDDGEIPFYKIGTFGGRPNAYISREIFERYKRLYPYPTKGDILISTSGSIGRVVEYTGQEAYYQDSNIVWLNHNDLISNSFLKYLYKTVNWNGVEGSTIKRLYNNNILKTKIRIPSSCEQEKIGGILSTLDHLLSHHQQKIDTVESIKQSLLQNMFI